MTYDHRESLRATAKRRDERERSQRMARVIVLWVIVAVVLITIPIASLR